MGGASNWRVLVLFKGLATLDSDWQRTKAGSGKAWRFSSRKDLGSPFLLLGRGVLGSPAHVLDQTDLS
jgi:hypothetical protein